MSNYWFFSTPILTWIAALITMYGFSRSEGGGKVLMIGSAAAFFAPLLGMAVTGTSIPDAGPRLLLCIAICVVSYWIGVAMQPAKASQ